MAFNAIVTPYDDNGYPAVATKTTPIAASAGTTPVKNGAGRLCRAVVTAAGTSTDNLTLYDAVNGTGAVLAVIPGGGAVGAIFALDLPALNGITAVNVGSGPAVTLGWS